MSDAELAQKIGELPHIRSAYRYQLLNFRWKNRSAYGQPPRYPLLC